MKSHGLMFLLMLDLFITTITATAPCDTILISGTQIRHEISGLYHRDSTSFCLNRPVFSQIRGDFKLFYHSTSGLSAWLLGLSECTNLASGRVMSGADHPAEAQEVWEEYNGDWIDNLELSVVCGDLNYRGCPTVSLSGTEYNQDIEGEYEVQSKSSICFGKFPYEHVSNPGNHIYFYHGHWVVGDALCTDEVFMQVSDGASYPYDVTNMWEENVDDGSVHQSLNTNMSCAVPPTTTTPNPEPTDPPGPDCSVVKVAGTTSRYDVTGLYRADGEHPCDSQTTYRQIGGIRYLYSVTSFRFTGWMIGESPCADSGAVAVETDGHHPAHASEKWREYNNATEYMYAAFSSNWDESPMSVECSSIETPTCTRMEVAATNYYSRQEGSYQLMAADDMCDGRFAYTTPPDHSDRSFLYYTGGYWRVGTSRCGEPGVLRALSQADDPQQVPAGIWEEYGIVWDTSPATVQCTGVVSDGVRLYQGTIVAIVTVLLHVQLLLF